jgi:hypothetical protein
MRTIFKIALILIFILYSIGYADEKSHRATAEELLKLLKTDRIMEPLFEQMKLRMDQQFDQLEVSEDKRPLLKKYTDKLTNLLRKETGWENIKNDFISVYIETFTEDEIRAISAFYKTPAGQTFIQKMPLLMKKSLEISQKKMPEMIEKMQQITSEMIEEMKDEIEKKPVRENSQKKSK